MGAAAATNRSKGEWMETLRWAYRAVLGLALLAGGLYAFHETEQHLISDPRFRFAGPPEYGIDPPGLKVEGVSFASRKQILEVFADDFGKSIYMLPIEKRRASLRRLEWVKDVTVARFWPNQVLVKVDERIPVALLQADAKRGWLVDADGILLSIPPQSTFRVPVVKGVSGKTTASQRSERIKRMLRVMAESGRHAERFTMVDVADMDNVKVSMMVGDRRLTLWLGGRNFQARLDGFEASYPRVMREMPNDTAFDLRLDSRISNVPAGGEDVQGE
jgi:cell division protein FtsQ